MVPWTPNPACLPACDGRSGHYRHDYYAIFDAMYGKKTYVYGTQTLPVTPEIINAWYRELILNDLFFILQFVMEIPPTIDYPEFKIEDWPFCNSPWVVDRCREVEDGPEGWCMDLWARGHFKAVDVNEFVPTPGGWKKHGDLEIGDYVFSPSGEQTKVTARTEVFTDADCYRVTFNDKTSVVVSGDHLWEVWSKSRRRIPGTKNKRFLRDSSVFSTRVLASLSHSPDNRMAIRLPDALEYSNDLLPVDPYVLGCWLGDGTSENGAITLCEEELVQNINAVGYETGTPWALGTRTVYGLSPKLRQLCVLNNKHIPERYLNSNKALRLALLQGLMDTDGTCDPRGTATFCNKSDRLAADVYDLVAGLGMNPHIRKHFGKVNDEPYPFWQVSFQAYKDIPPFRLKRKIANCAEKRTFNYRYITSVAPCDTIPVSCIQVEAGNGLYLVGKSLITTHNSTIKTIARTIQRMAKYPNKCTMIASHTRPAAKKFLRSIMQYTEKSDILKCAFPDVFWSDPRKEAPKWSEDDGIVVKRSSVGRVEATVEAWGLKEGMPIGVHFDWILSDDLETKDDVKNPAVIQQVRDAMDLTEDLLTGGGSVDITGTPYSHEGVYVPFMQEKQRASGKAAFHFRKHPATDDGTPLGKAVFLPSAVLDDIRARKGEYSYNTQQLIDPTPTGVRKLDGKMLKDIDPKEIPGNVIRFMLIDPAGDARNEDGDSWACLVFGVLPYMARPQDASVFILDAFISPMRAEEAPVEIARVYRRNGLIMQTGIEKTAASLVANYVSNILARDHHIYLSEERKTLVMLKPAGRDKQSRIENAIAYPLYNELIRISTAVPAVYRDRIRTEMDKFPFWHDDALDTIAYLYDMIQDFHFEWVEEDDDDSNVVDIRTAGDVTGYNG
jgi:hypothetical protein